VRAPLQRYARIVHFVPMRTYFSTRYLFDPGRSRVWRAICEYLQPSVPPSSAVLDLGCGYCDFINQIRADTRYALDASPAVAQYCAHGVQFLCASAPEIPLPPQSVDVVFSSNLLEHLTDSEIDELFTRLRTILRPRGRIILIQPNYFYAYREYWNDYTHRKAFSHVSLCDLLSAKGFSVRRSEKRFLPFSFRSVIPKSYWLTRLYLMSPSRPMAKQMLIVADMEE
jgi:SAM-dependent methyltransferase